MIENLGAALDQYDTIDFSDNEIRKLDGFPFMNRVKSLMMNNNRIVRSILSSPSPSLFQDVKVRGVGVITTL